MTSTPFPDLDLTQWLAERIREAKAQAWEEGYYEAELHEARKLGFRNPDNYPINPGPILPALTVVEINPHEVTP